MVETLQSPVFAHDQGNTTTTAASAVASNQDHSQAYKKMVSPTTDGENAIEDETVKNLPAKTAPFNL